jgi:hypothetical protein
MRVGGQAEKGIGDGKGKGSVRGIWSTHDLGAAAVRWWMPLVVRRIFHRQHVA